MHNEKVQEALKDIGLALCASHNTVTTDQVGIEPDELSWRIDNTKEIALVEQLEQLFSGDPVIVELPGELSKQKSADIRAAINSISSDYRPITEQVKALALTWNMGAASLPPEEYVQLEAIIKNISSARNIDNECMADWQIKISGKEQHDSDCETSNAPAMIPGPCDCDTPNG